ncbi:ceramide phosphoethanolamine synthase-like [Clytia hemisphaerica]|uniref:Ceramide phosphoethanolamine synthase n=1 Tax=Clytia hemisphaerica TaxID=252671 RepID=A0A7M5WQI2_9CNID
MKGKIDTPPVKRSNWGFYGFFALMTYFIWSDLAFFGEMSSEQNHLSMHLRNGSALEKKTIKLRMQDHFAHHLYLPFCEWMERNFHLSQIPGVTPNAITALHFSLAIIAGRLIASSSFSHRRAGAVIYFIRNMLDTLDGVIYRAKSKSTDYLSGWGTYGYMIDGMADTIGGLFIMIGTIYRLNKHLPIKNPEILPKLKNKYRNYDAESGERLLSADESCSENEKLEEGYGLKRYSRQTVNLTIFFFTLTVIVRSALWDHFNHGYHELLAQKRPDISPMKQEEVLGYGSTWFSLWLWKIMSADAFMHYTLIALFFGKIWAWLRFNLYFTIPNVIIVSMICQIHLMQMRYLLGVSH